jgi:predicted ATP-dependent serine protease
MNAFHTAMAVMSDAFVAAACAGLPTLLCRARQAQELHTATHEHSVRVLTGLPGLDAALRIGLPPGAITELVGPAGVGKSQMCYTIALQVRTLCSAQNCSSGVGHEGRADSHS